MRRPRTATKGTESGHSPALCTRRDGSQLARPSATNSPRHACRSGKPSEPKRSEDDDPLPHAYMGDLLRFNRDEVDAWARHEAERRRAQSEKRRLKIA